jgi:hypothetical protein
MFALVPGTEPRRYAIVQQRHGACTDEVVVMQDQSAHFPNLRVEEGGEGVRVDHDLVSQGDYQEVVVVTLL